MLTENIFQDDLKLLFGNSILPLTFIYSKILCDSRNYVLSGGSNANRSLSVCVTFTEKRGLPEVRLKQLCL